MFGISWYDSWSCHIKQSVTQKLNVLKTHAVYQSFRLEADSFFSKFEYVNPNLVLLSPVLASNS